MNVLLTCAGRRNYLVQYFRSALHGRGFVFAADADEAAPALQEADQGFIVPSIQDPSYFDILTTICERYEVRLLLSLNDLELPLLARERERFDRVGVCLIVSSLKVIDICTDKWATVQFLKSCDLATPPTFFSLERAQKTLTEGIISFPLILKPRWGSASFGIERVNNESELQAAYQLLKGRIAASALAQIKGASSEDNILIQEALDGQEHGLDIVNDLDGQYVTTFVKRKLRMRAGETEQAVTENDERLVKLGETIGRELGHLGNLDCDVFVNGDQMCVLEMNPRFGGGYPFSHAAGANLPAALLAWADGNQASPEWLTIHHGVTASKYDRVCIIDRDKLNRPSLSLQE